MTELSRIIERTNHGSLLMEAAFGTVLRQPGISSIADIGSGDANLKNAAMLHDKSVLRVDVDYANTPPEHGAAIAGSATELPIASNSVDAVISSFLMQHLDAHDQASAITEMLRIARNDEGNHTGLVGIYPVYKSSKLAPVLHKALPGLAGLSFDEAAMERVPLGSRLEYDTLWILKQDGVDYTEAAAAIARSGALNRRTTLRDLGRRARMRTQGTNIADVS